jgi:hypothetical protein
VVRENLIDDHVCIGCQLYGRRNATRVLPRYKASKLEGGGWKPRTADLSTFLFGSPRSEVLNILELDMDTSRYSSSSEYVDEYLMHTTLPSWCSRLGNHLISLSHATAQAMCRHRGVDLFILVATLWSLNGREWQCLPVVRRDQFTFQL